MKHPVHSAGGRPALPAAERKSAKHSFRLDAAGEAQLAAIKRHMRTDDESEVMRLALDTLAELTVGRSS